MRLERSPARTLQIAALAALALSGCTDNSSPGPSQQPQPGLIVPQRSIDRLALGMTPIEVRRLFGRPDSTDRASESETGKPIYIWTYREQGLRAAFRARSGRVSLDDIETTMSAHRTASGAGVASTEAELEASIDGLHCAPTNPGERWCTLGPATNGSPQTVFVIRRGKVTAVRVLITSA